MPFCTLACRGWYWPTMITIWHREPGGHDSGEVCKHYRRERDGGVRVLRGWRWHVHHWRIRVGPLQSLRRWALTRCAWCGGRHRRRDPVNVSHQWDAPRTSWWRGERHLYHRGCSMIESAHRMCVCLPTIGAHARSWVNCPDCGKPRGKPTPASLRVRRVLAQVPAGGRGLAELAYVERIRRDTA